MFRRTELFLLVSQIIHGEMQWQLCRFDSEEWLSRLKMNSICNNNPKRPNVILMAVQIPIMNGLQATVAICQFEM